MVDAARLVAVVDDDPSILRALRRLLRVAGYAVQTFVSGEELLEWPGLATVDCLVLDVNLAGLSGIQVQERLRERRLAIPIVFITAQDDAATREAAQRGGEARYLRKPFDDQTLVAEIRLALAGV